MKNPFIQSSPSSNNQAKVKLVLRIVVALYILYMTKALITSAVKGTSPVPLWVTVLVSTVFISASVVFGLYSWKEYKRSLALEAKEDAEGDQEDSQAEDDDNE